MGLVLQQAHLALSTNDEKHIEELKDLIILHRGKYDQVKTKFFGETSLSGTIGVLSKVVSTTTKQPGWHVERLVNKTLELSKRKLLGNY